MNPKLSLALFSALLFAACSKESPAHPTGTHTHADGTVHKDEAPGHGGHGEEVALGEVKLGDHSIQVTQAGKVEAGKEAAFELTFGKGKPLPGTVRGWIGIESAQGSMKAKFDKEGDAGMHGHVETPKPIPAGSKLWLEVETPAGTSKASVAFRL
jgi:hypothetical protein